MPNILQQVVAYAKDNVIPALEHELTVLSYASTNYKTIKVHGNSGASILINKPPRHVTRNTFSLNMTEDNASSNFQQNSVPFTVTQKSASHFSCTSEEMALYDIEDYSWAQNSGGCVAEIAAEANAYASKIHALAGYRFALNDIDPRSDISAYKNANMTYAETVKNVRVFQNYGGRNQFDYILPSDVTAAISETGSQRFTPVQNDKNAKAYSISNLSGVGNNCRFMESETLPIFTAGTACDSATTESKITIKSIEDTTHKEDGVDQAGGNEASKIVLQGDLTQNETFVPGDLFDIVNEDNVADIKLVQYVGHEPSRNNVQCKVITGGSVNGSNEVELVVIPRLKAKTDGKKTPDTSLTRDIALGKDLVRPVKSGRRGFLHVHGTAFFAAPELPKTDPYPSTTVKASNGNVSMLAYHGYFPLGSGHAMDHQLLYDAMAVPEYSMQIILPSDV